MGTKDDAETIIANLRFAIRQASAGGGDGVVHLSSEACRKVLDEIDRLRAVEAVKVAAIEDVIAKHAAAVGVVGPMPVEDEHAIRLTRGDRSDAEYREQGRAVAAGVDRLRAVEVAAWLLLGHLEDPGATPEDETRAALDLRRALGEPIDPLAALEAAEEVVLVAGGWTRTEDLDFDGEHRWTHPEHGIEAHLCALAIERYHHEARARAAKSGGAS
jgi:hypothetical protein